MSDNGPELAEAARWWAEWRKGQHDYPKGLDEAESVLLDAVEGAASSDARYLMTIRGADLHWFEPPEPGAELVATHAVVHREPNPYDRRHEMNRTRLVLLWRKRGTP